MPLHRDLARALVLAACVCACVEGAAANASAGDGLQPSPPPPPRPFGSAPLRDYGTLALTFLFGAAATASGVGGGAIFVPLFDAVLGLGIKRAAAISQVAITAGALSGVGVLLSRTRPGDAGATLIDLNLAALMTPALLLGVSLGVLANSLLPPWLLTALLLVLLAAVSLSTFLKGRALHRLESAAQEAAAAKAGAPCASEAREAAAANAGAPRPPPAAGLSSPVTTIARPRAHRLDLGDRATSDAFEAALSALTPRSMRSSRAPPAGAVDPAAEVAAATATVAAAAAALETEEAHTKPPHPLLTCASAVPLATLACLWLLLTGLQVWRALSTKCSPAWVAAIAVQVACAALATLLLVARAVAAARPSSKTDLKCAPGGGGVCGRESALHTPGRLIIAATVAVLGGFIGGMLGLGGGILIAPLLLALRLPPPVAAATSTLLVLFSSSSAAVAAAATPGAMAGSYVAAFAPVAALAGGVGVVVAARFVKQSGRESWLVFLLAAVVAAGAVLAGVRARACHNPGPLCARAATLTSIHTIRPSPVPSTAALSGARRRRGGDAGPRRGGAATPVALAAGVAAAAATMPAPSATRGGPASTSGGGGGMSVFDDPDRLYKLLLAGGVAGAVSRTLTAPVDRLKMLLQVHDHAHAMTIRDGIRTMAAEGTVRSWFRGNGCNVLKIAPETALKLACNDRIKRLVASDPAAITPGERFVAGAAAGAVAQGAIYPLELVRTRLAVSPPGSYRGIVDAAAQVWVREGPRAFYRGIGPSLIGILPYAGVDIAIFEILKDKLVESSGGRPPPAAILAAGMVSSSIAQFVSYPLALCRTRLQAQGRGGAPLKYSSALDVLRQALAREGFRGLYKGIGPNLAKVAPAAGISWFVFEEVKRATGLDSSRGAGA